MGSPPKKPRRGLLGGPFVTWLLASLGALYIRLVMATTRWEVIGAEHREAALRPGTGFVAVTWHGRLMILTAVLPKDRNCIAMISNDRDGTLISAIVARFGAATIRGSTYDVAKRRDKGGAGAYAQALKSLSGQDAIIGMTPDGPRGPRMRAQRGVAMLSIQGGCPVLPLAFSVRRGKTLGSWDRFLLPFPFGRGVIRYGAVLSPPQGDDLEATDAYLAKVEAALVDITQEADRLCGRPQIEPGEMRGPGSSTERPPRRDAGSVKGN